MDWKPEMEEGYRAARGELSSAKMAKQDAADMRPVTAAKAGATIPVHQIGLPLQSYTSISSR